MPPKRTSKNAVGPRFINNVVPWIETYYHNHKTFPSDSLLMTQFGMSREKLDALYRSKLFKDALERRGIERRHHLRPEQVACISVMTNFADTRSQEVKLASIGVTPEMFQGWLSQPIFKRELTARSEEILENTMPDALSSLATQVRKGNTSALKMYFEMTGRAQSQEVMNSRKLVTTVLEALQTHVRDPETLLAITRDIMGDSPQLANLPLQVTVGETEAE